MLGRGGSRSVLAGPKQPLRPPAHRPAQVLAFFFEYLAKEVHPSLQGALLVTGATAFLILHSQGGGACWGLDSAENERRLRAARHRARTLHHWGTAAAAIVAGAEVACLVNALQVRLHISQCSFTGLTSFGERGACRRSTLHATPYTCSHPPQVPGKQLVLLAVNDNPYIEQAGGGSHWSLLAYSAHDSTFRHYDSAQGSNRRPARQLAGKLSGALGWVGGQRHWPHAWDACQMRAPHAAAATVQGAGCSAGSGLSLHERLPAVPHMMQAEPLQFCRGGQPATAEQLRLRRVRAGYCAAALSAVCAAWAGHELRGAGHQSGECICAAGRGAQHHRVQGSGAACRAANMKCIMPRHSVLKTPQHTKWAASKLRRERAGCLTATQLVSRQQHCKEAAPWHQHRRSLSRATPQTPPHPG